MKYISILIFSVFIILSVVPVSAMDDLDIKIVGKHAQPPYKMSIDLRISRRMNETELKGASTALYNQVEGKEYQRVFITWYLPGMVIDSGAWATTHYNPELKVTIMDYMLEMNPTTLK
jgi:hypothetical protein